MLCKAGISRKIAEQQCLALQGCLGYDWEALDEKRENPKNAACLQFVSWDAVQQANPSEPGWRKFQLSCNANCKVTGTNGHNSQGQCYVAPTKTGLVSSHIGISPFPNDRGCDYRAARVMWCGL